MFVHTERERDRGTDADAEAEVGAETNAGAPYCEHSNTSTCSQAVLVFPRFPSSLVPGDREKEEERVRGREEGRKGGREGMKGEYHHHYRLNIQHCVSKSRQIWREIVRE